MQILVFLVTVSGGIYFLMFDKESPIAITLATLAPLGMLGLFLLRFLTERKKRKEEISESGPREKKKFKDPNDLLKERS